MARHRHAEPVLTCPLSGDEKTNLARTLTSEIEPDRTSLIKTKFFVGAIGRDLADPPGAPFPDHPQ